MFTHPEEITAHNDRALVKMGLGRLTSGNVALELAKTARSKKRKNPRKLGPGEFADNDPLKPD